MPTGSILAYSVPSGAQVLVDGQVRSTMFGFARTPAVIPDIPAGERSVTFTLPSYQDVTMVANVPQGGYYSITAIMVPKK